MVTLTKPLIKGENKMTDLTIREKIIKIVWKLRVEFTDERFEKAIADLCKLVKEGGKQ